MNSFRHPTQTTETPAKPLPLVAGLRLDFRQAQAYAEWQKLRGERDLPLRSDLRPEKLGSALPACVLLHVLEEDGGPVFRQQIEGKLVASAFGTGSGRRIEEIYPRGHIDNVVPHYLEALALRSATMSEGFAGTEGGRDLAYTRLILPFVDDDGRIARLLTVFSFTGRIPLGGRSALARRGRQENLLAPFERRRA